MEQNEAAIEWLEEQYDAGCQPPSVSCPRHMFEVIDDLQEHRNGRWDHQVEEYVYGPLQECRPSDFGHGWDYCMDNPMRIIKNDYGTITRWNKYFL